MATEPELTMSTTILADRELHSVLLDVLQAGHDADFPIKVLAPLAWVVVDGFRERRHAVTTPIGEMIDFVPEHDRNLWLELVAAVRKVLAEVPPTCAVGDGPVIAWSTLDALRNAVGAVEPEVGGET